MKRHFPFDHDLDMAACFLCRILAAYRITTQPRHAAHNRQFRGHSVGIRAANRHASGTSGPEERRFYRGAEVTNHT